MDKKDKKNGKLLLGLAVGLLIGAGLGILYAPDSGKNTRDKLAYRLSKYRNKLKKLIENLVEGKQEGPMTAAKSEGQKVINDTKEKAEKLLGDVEDMISKILKKK